MNTAKILLLCLFLGVGLTGCQSASKSEAKSSESEKAQKEASKTENPKQESGEAMWSKTCKVEGDERKIEVVEKGEGCEVVYTKNGSTTQPASSRRGTAYCEEVATRIQNNLSNAGFECQ